MDASQTKFMMNLESIGLDLEAISKKSSGAVEYWYGYEFVCIA